MVNPRKNPQNKTKAPEVPQTTEVLVLALMVFRCPANTNQNNHQAALAAPDAIAVEPISVIERGSAPGVRKCTMTILTRAETTQIGIQRPGWNDRSGEKKTVSENHGGEHDRRHWRDKLAPCTLARNAWRTRHR